MLISLILAGCKSPPVPQVGTPPVPEPPPDLTERLAADQARAGAVTDEQAFFGGVSAEGELGDYKIYNDRVQFIIQSAREGSYYVQTGGGVIDADIVRPEGMAGRDLVDEWGAMVGFGRLVQPQQIVVISDGSNGSAAVIEVQGSDVPLALLGGALEAPDFIESYGLEATTTFRLEPGSWLMEVTTTVSTPTAIPALAMGDLVMGAPEAADGWTRGTGLQANTSERGLTGYIDKGNAGAVAVLPLPGETLAAGGAVGLISELVDLVLGFETPADLAEGGTRSWTRYYGVGPDLATLSDAVMPEESATTSGTVTAPDGPVAGARVHVLVDGAPWTVAITGEDGTFSARVPDGTVTTIAEGQGPGLFDDLPAGHTSWPAFAATPVFERAQASLIEGAPSMPLAQGRGTGTGTDGLTLAEPGRIRVEVADGLPFTVRIGSASNGDPQWVPPRPGGLHAAGWSRGEPLALALEPGTHDIVVHRGMRYEAFVGTVEITAGEFSSLEVELPEAFTHAGYIAGDPHAHASPSGDGQITMEDRILVTAAGGVQLHFGSDHDRVADYRPLVTTLGLDPVLRSVVADEVSSVIRGHFNAYPLVPDPTLPNHGAVHWWEGVPETTDALVAEVRERHGDVVIQSNHPVDNGLLSAADWSPGDIGRPSHYPSDLDAMEVLNDGEHDEFTAVWSDLLNRGTVLTPVGVSDSHGHFSATPGLNLTFIGMGTDDVTSVDDSDLLAAFARRDTVASLGVFLDLSIAPGSVLTAPASLSVEAKSASWAEVSRLHLYVDGELAETVEGTVATFQLDRPEDASFVVVAEGDSPMFPVSNERPWALASAILLDRAGDGWDPPLPPLTGPTP